MKFTRLAIIALVVSLATTNTGQAESKWSLKKLIPGLGQKDDTPRGLYPPSSEPSMWKKFNHGTKNLFAKTKSVMPPWLMPGTQDKVRRSGHGIKESSGRLREELRTARRKILRPWRDTPAQVNSPQTVSDFLGQPRPE